MSEAALEAVLRRDRAVVVLALAAITILAWIYVLWLANAMPGAGRMDTMMAPMTTPWSPVNFLFTLVMWVVMMVGMMTPAVAPMILLYAVVGRQAAAQARPLASAGWFAGGYFLAWSLFALLATVAQGVLQRETLLTPMLSSARGIFGGVVLIAAGAMQWTPIKDACLARCQSPMQFMQRYGGFRAHASGSLRLGLLHGAYCIGCCWALMALLFVGGVMNVLWIAGLAILVLLEKSIPGRLVPRLAGIVLIGAGLWLLAGQ